MPLSGMHDDLSVSPYNLNTPACNASGSQTFHPKLCEASSVVLVCWDWMRNDDPARIPKELYLSVWFFFDAFICRPVQIIVDGFFNSEDGRTALRSHYFSFAGELPWWLWVILRYCAVAQLQVSLVFKNTQSHRREAQRDWKWMKPKHDNQAWQITIDSTSVCLSLSSLTIMHVQADLHWKGKKMFFIDFDDRLHNHEGRPRLWVMCAINTAFVYLHADLQWGLCNCCEGEAKQTGKRFIQIHR